MPLTLVQGGGGGRVVVGQGQGIPEAFWLAPGFSEKTLSQRNKVEGDRGGHPASSSGPVHIHLAHYRLLKKW